MTIDPTDTTQPPSSPTRASESRTPAAPAPDSDTDVRHLRLAAIVLCVGVALSLGLNVGLAWPPAVLYGTISVVAGAAGWLGGKPRWAGMLGCAVGGVSTVFVLSTSLQGGGNVPRIYWFVLVLLCVAPGVFVYDAVKFLVDLATGQARPVAPGEVSQTVRFVVGLVIVVVVIGLTAFMIVMQR